MLLEGKSVAEKIKKDIMTAVKARKDAGLSIPKVALLRVGENPEDVAYERKIIKNCQSVGIDSDVIALDQKVSMAEFMKVLEELNRASEVHGIMIFRPLTSQLDVNRISEAICPEKDIDCMGLINMAKVFAGDRSAMEPCTAEAVVEILKHYYGDLSGKNAVIVNRSLVLGKPLAMLLLGENATVTLCHSRTQDLARLTSQADIVITGIGKGKFFGPEYFSEKSIVLDAGINFVDGKLCGDVDFEPVSKKVQSLTPVPGGVGTVTSMLLLRNVIKGMRLQEETFGA